MLFLQLNDKDGYCLDGVYLFHSDPEKLRQVMRELASRLNTGVPRSALQSIDAFRPAVSLTAKSIDGLHAAWSVRSAQSYCDEEGLVLSDASLAACLQARSGEWMTHTYGLPGFPVREGDNSNWLVDNWHANLAYIGHSQRCSFLQLLPNSVVEIILEPVRDPDLGPYWEAHIEQFSRCDPRSPRISRNFLGAASDKESLEHELVCRHQELTEQVKHLEIIAA